MDGRQLPISLRTNQKLGSRRLHFASERLAFSTFRRWLQAKSKMLVVPFGIDAGDERPRVGSLA